MRDQPADLPEPLPSPVPDSHCHLDAITPYCGLEPADALRRAASVNITRVVQVGCDVASSRWAVEAAQRWPQVVAAVAIHPNDAARLGAGLTAALADIEALLEADAVAGTDRIRAVGETGLDYFRTTDQADQAVQKDAFAAHIALAKRYGTTLIIHDRDAHRPILDVLDAEGAPERVVMHCFSGDADFARECLDRGFFLSFPGPVTYKPNDALREACRITPDDRLLTETDAPYLTPVPLRGWPNAPYLVPHTVRFLAELRGAELAVLCASLDATTTAAFGAWEAAQGPSARPPA